MTVTKESLIGDVLDYDINTAEFFFEIGMHCLGCPSSRGESIEDACAVHGTDADELVEKINDYAFRNCALTAVTVPNPSCIVSRNAFDSSVTVTQ